MRIGSIFCSKLVVLATIALVSALAAVACACATIYGAMLSNMTAVFVGVALFLVSSLVAISSGALYLIERCDTKRKSAYIIPQENTL